MGGCSTKHATEREQHLSSTGRKVQSTSAISPKAQTEVFPVSTLGSTLPLRSSISLSASASTSTSTSRSRSTLSPSQQQQPCTQAPRVVNQRQQEHQGWVPLRLFQISSRGADACRGTYMYLLYLTSFLIRSFSDLIVL